MDGWRDMESATVAQIGALVEPVLTDLACELVEIQLRNEQIGLVLRVVIHKEGGVSLDDCTAVSRAVGSLLEVEDPIGKPYHLEVSSPGLDRPLRTARDFARNLGQKVGITLRRGEELAMVTGTIVGVDDIKVAFEVDGRPEEVPLTDIVKARLVIEF